MKVFPHLALSKRCFASEAAMAIGSTIWSEMWQDTLHFAHFNCLAIKPEWSVVERVRGCVCACVCVGGGWCACEARRGVYFRATHTLSHTHRPCTALAQECPSTIGREGL